LLAALLITRQVMGNIKESLIPFVKKQAKLAKINYDLYGGAGTSPTSDESKSVVDGGGEKKSKIEDDDLLGLDDEEEGHEVVEDGGECDGDGDEEKPHGRHFSQMENESAATPVIHYFCTTKCQNNTF
jgi:hypothetical protein